MCLGNIAKDSTPYSMKKKTELNKYLYDFSVNYNIVDTSNDNI